MLKTCHAREPRSLRAGVRPLQHLGPHLIPHVGSELVPGGGGRGGELRARTLGGAQRNGGPANTNETKACEKHSLRKERSGVARWRTSVFFLALLSSQALSEIFVPFHRCLPGPEVRARDDGGAVPKRRGRPPEEPEPCRPTPSPAVCYDATPDAMCCALHGAGHQ